jgi:hypothetical protein
MSRGLVEHQKILWLEIHIDIRYSRIANMGHFSTNGKASAGPPVLQLISLPSGRATAAVA